MTIRAGPKHIANSHRTAPFRALLAWLKDAFIASVFVFCEVWDILLAYFFQEAIRCCKKLCCKNFTAKPVSIIVAHFILEAKMISDHWILYSSNHFAKLTMIIKHFYSDHPFIIA